MTNYTPDLVPEAGGTANLRTGTASADAVQAGSTLLINNTGAGSHNVDLTINYLWHGLSPGSAATPGKRRYTISAGAWLALPVLADYADANGNVALAIDGTASEVKFFVLGT